MKRALVILLFCAVSLRAYWLADTSTMQATRITFVNKMGGRKFSCQLESNKPVRFTMEYRLAVKWLVNCDSAAGVIKVFRSFGRADSAILTQTIVKGINDVRMFCESDDYRIVSSIPCRARFYKWRPPYIAPIVPVGGGFPVQVISKDSTDSYYYVSRDTSATLKVLGPATAYIYVRPYAPVVTGSFVTYLEFEVREKDSVVAHTRVRPIPSGLSAFAKPVIGFEPGKPSLTKLMVGGGRHEYTVKVNDRALVMFYSKPDMPKILSKPHPPQPILGIDSSTPQMKSVAATGLAYNDNVFTYGVDKTNGYPPAQNESFRYPHVRSLGDISIPARLRADYEQGHLLAHGGIEAEGFCMNSQLSRLKYFFGIGLKGPQQNLIPHIGSDTVIDSANCKIGQVIPDTTWDTAKGPLQGRVYVCLDYSGTPYHPIRPTKTDVPSVYSMLSYESHQIDLMMGLKNLWNPLLRLTYGYYDYVSPFDYLDAIFIQGDVRLSQETIFGVVQTIAWNSSIGFGAIQTLKATNYNWSNFYFCFKGGASLDIKDYTFGLTAALVPRFFSTGSDTDFNKGRKDLDIECTPFIHYRFARQFMFSANICSIVARKTWAANAQDELAKSYFALGGEVMLSITFTPLDWLQPSQG